MENLYAMNLYAMNLYAILSANQQVTFLRSPHDSDTSSSPLAFRALRLG